MTDTFRDNVMSCIFFSFHTLRLEKETGIDKTEERNCVKKETFYAAVLVCRYIFKEEFETQKQNNPIKSPKETHGELIVLAIIKICS